MIYFFYDNKTGESFKKAQKLFNDLQKKKPEGTFLSFGSDNVSLESLREASQSQGLFESKVVCFLKNIIENDEVVDSLKKIVKEMKESASIFVWIETSLKKAELEILKENAEKSFLEKEVAKEKVKEFNAFKIADSFGARDKKNFWKYVLEAKNNGVAGEETHGILWWQLKSIILASGSKTADESGLKPFVFSKSKSFAKNFKEDELQKMANEFIEIYHKAHRGECDIYDELEKVALGF